ncbi:uncharacterized protein LOC121880221 isoform X1 [Homarus americanus]|uniref:uncharacterized protein LOC121880221 isoform X1 n=1 Tax=Homarus americanus TaxID=6706 RepID=UPI001C47A463|nr:uncharacterized protein LOC121880221 isoform X1 [Homarus americanus]
MADSIENELDILFRGSVWSREYNHSQVITFSEGSLLVRAQLVLNTADEAAAQKLGTAFLRGLHNRHGHEWLGQYSVDITSIRFTEVVVVDTLPLSTTTSPATTTVATEESSTVVMEASHRLPSLNVGWGEWGPWSTCSPCSPQYDQIRTRQCRLDAGRGILVNSIEPCLPSGLGGQLQGTGGDLETRPCQCDHTLLDSTTTTTTTTMSTTTTTKSTTTPPPWKDEQPQKEERVDEMSTERLCDSCLPGEVCVGLQGEAYPTCRTARDSGDRTGCGGLCAIDSEVCQALGSRAFQCHSASLCLHDEWRCADGLCIPHIKRCDGHMNCYDQSDELHCRCGPDKFQCGNNTSCLPVTSKCDGKMDCWDGSDEANCTTSKGVCPNPDTQFTCRSSQCIPQHQFCDGLEDCRDGSDEPFGCFGRCQPNEHQCRNRRCIPASSVCDGGDTCGDNSDEQDCNRTLVTLPPRTGAPLLNLSSTRSLIGTTLLNVSTMGGHQTTARTDRIWLLHLGGSNASNMENTPSVNAFPSSFTNTEDRGNASFALYITKSLIEQNPSTSTTMPQISGISTDNNTYNDKRDRKSEGIFNANDALSQSDSHGRVSPVIDRSWRRTAQVMPSMEEFGDAFGHKVKKDPVTG